MSRKYGISAISTFPYGWGIGGFDRAIEIAREAGYGGLQILPIRGWTYPKWNERFVYATEDAWNFGNLGQALKRLTIRPGEDAPTLVDWLFFGRKYVPLYSKAILSAHHFPENPNDSVQPMVVEIHPELSSNKNDYLSYVNRGGQLCWDTFHVRRGHRDGGASPFNWRWLLVELPQNSIGLIHVHIVKSELADFLAGTAEVNDMLLLLREIAPDTTAIVEVTPPMLSTKSNTVSFLANVLKVTKAYLG